MNIFFNARDKHSTGIRNRIAQPSLGQGCQMVCFQTKNPTWENFEGPHNGKSWYILCSFGIVYGHLVYYMAIW
jgi:hypothetical protein